MDMASIPEILDELRAGRFIVLVDDPKRENEGDLILAADKATPERINFMLMYGRGEVCTTLPHERADKLDLHMQAASNTSPLTCAKTVTVDYGAETSTGVSASDQAATIRRLAHPSAAASDFTRPGHTRPIRAVDGGVLVRTGHTEGSVDLVRMSGFSPVGVLCEILDDQGEPMRLPALREYSRRHSFKMTSIAELVRYRRATERLVNRQVTTRIPTRHGTFDLHLYANRVDPNQHVALTLGLGPHPDEGPSPPLDDPVVVRVHSECLTGDIFGSLRCDCGSQLDAALAAIGREGRGALLYLRQEGRGIGLENKLLAYRLQEHGMDTVEANKTLGFKADERNYGIGAQILHDLGVRQMRLMTNNPKKLHALDGFGLSVVGRIPLEIQPTKESEAYLRAKRDKLGHLLTGLATEA